MYEPSSFWSELATATKPVGAEIVLPDASTNSTSGSEATTSPYWSFTVAVVSNTPPLVDNKVSFFATVTVEASLAAFKVISNVLLATVLPSASVTVTLTGTTPDFNTVTTPDFLSTTA